MLALRLAIAMPLKESNFVPRASDSRAMRISRLLQRVGEHFALCALSEAA
jgi:hypothetical protein